MPTASGPLRTLVATLPFAVGYEYKITPTSNLKSGHSTGDGSGNPAVAWDGDYTFIVAPMCAADASGDGVVGIADLLAVIGAWGACGSPPCDEDVAPVPCSDDDIGIGDLLAVIGQWGCFCAPLTGEGGISGEGMPQDIDDCMDMAAEAGPIGSDRYEMELDGCIQRLCEEELIECD